MLPGFKLYYKAMLIKIVHYQQKNRSMNSRDSPEIS